MNDQTLTNEELLKEFKRLLKESDKIEVPDLGITNLPEQISNLIDILVVCNQTLLILTDKVNKSEKRIESYEGRPLNSVDVNMLKQELRAIQEDLKKILNEQFILLRVLLR